MAVQSEVRHRSCKAWLCTAVPGTGEAARSKVRRRLAQARRCEAWLDGGKALQCIARTDQGRGIAGRCVAGLSIAKGDAFAIYALRAIDFRRPRPLAWRRTGPGRAAPAAEALNHETNLAELENGNR